MKYFIATLFVLVFLTASGQKMSYKDWQEESKNNIRLLPEYGNVPKTEAQKEADQKFIEESLKTDGSNRKASEHLVSLGFNYFNRGDIKTAMYRFNQAWLLDPKNENAYWGFGAIYFSFSDYENALKMYNKGLSINPKSSNILTDKATIYMAKLNDKFDDATLKKATDLFIQSYKIDPTNQNTLFKLSTLYFSMNDCKNALKYYNECKNLGGKPITEEYANALKEKCK